MADTRTVVDLAVEACHKQLAVLRLAINLPLAERLAREAPILADLALLQGLKRQ